MRQDFRAHLHFCFIQCAVDTGIVDLARRAAVCSVCAHDDIICHVFFSQPALSPEATQPVADFPCQTAYHQDVAASAAFAGVVRSIVEAFERRCYCPCMNNCETCVVRNRAICSVLDGPELDALSSIGRTRMLLQGESLFWEGEESVVVANVIDGALKLSAQTEDGREQIVGVVYPSDFVGRPFGGASGYGVTALTDTRICVFARPDFEKFASDHPALERKLLERTLAELDRTRHWMLLLGRKSASEKIASFLLEMIERLNPPSGCELRFEYPGIARTLQLPFSRQQIADILGLTIETVSRQFTRLKQQGMIDLPTRREVSIINPAALQAEAG